MTEILNISEAEWEVMRVVWTLKKAKSRTITSYLSDKMDWKASTVKTLIGRLVKKDYLEAEKDGNSFTYFPLIAENKSNEKLAVETFNNMCAMCAGDTLLSVVKSLKLSKNDINNLINELNNKLKTAPDEIACDCLSKRTKEEE